MAREAEDLRWWSRRALERWRRLARYEHAEEWKILHAQDAQKLYIHGTKKRRVVVAIGVCCGCCWWRWFMCEEGGECSSWISTEEELCSEWTWRTEDKSQKNKKCKWDVQKGSVAERATRCSRTMIRRVSHCWALYHYSKFQIQRFIFQGGWEVLGRIVVLRGSSGCLNTGSWCFLLVGAREYREMVLSASCSLLNRGCSLIMSWCSYVS